VLSQAALQPVTELVRGGQAHRHMHARPETNSGSSSRQKTLNPVEVYRRGMENMVINLTLFYRLIIITKKTTKIKIGILNCKVISLLQPDITCQ
jgi:hypothetical protein